MRADPPIEKVRELLRLDAEAGQLRWIGSGAVAGPNGRVAVGEYRIPTLRAAWLLTHGESARGAVLPRDGNRLNLRPENLVDCGAQLTVSTPIWPESGPEAPARPLTASESCLNASMARAVFVYEGQTGNVVWREDRRTRNGSLTAKAGEAVGSLNRDGYLVVGFCPKAGERPRYYLVHRLIWLIETGQWPLIEIDHRNGIKTDNRWSNLRHITRQGNSENVRHARSNNKSTGLLGAYFNPKTGGFRSSIKHNGRSHNLGNFDTPEEAHNAYVAAKRRIHEGGTL